MSELVEFLRARLNEDEAAARKAAAFKYDRPTDAPWERARLAIEQGTGLSSDGHIARWTPARVLADIGAKRKIIERHTPRSELQHETVGDPLLTSADRTTIAFEHWTCPTCCEERCAVEGGHDTADAVDCCLELRLLAEPYAEHPAYQEAWRP